MTVRSDDLARQNELRQVTAGSRDRMFRPQLFEDFIGQQVTKDQLHIAIQAAKMRGEALDHTLLCGPPGLGKTTIANIVANELGVDLHRTSGPVLERKGDVAACLTALSEFGVLFIDEIHRLHPVVEEVLYPAMEDFKFDIMLGEGPNARAYRIDLQPFTLIGATTRAGMLTSPLRDRFGLVQRLDYYDAESLARITARTATMLNVNIDPEACEEIAKRARGTPRIANHLLQRVRDFGQVKDRDRIDGALTGEAMDFHQVDPRGLNQLDTKLLKSLIERFNGRAGLETLAAATGEESGTLEDVVEPYLIQLGFLEKTPRGRVATSGAYEYFGYEGYGGSHYARDLLADEGSTNE